MTAILKRVAETSVTTGTGDFTLAGADTTSFGPTIRTFAAAAGTGNTGYTFYYSIIHRNANEWEDGVGFINASGLLVRHIVLTSSNNNALVNFSAGTKSVICTNQGTLRDQFYGGAANLVASQLWQAPQEYTEAGGVTLTANRGYMVPYSFDRETIVAEWMINVSTVSATGRLYAALCERITATTFRVVLNLGDVAASGTAGIRAFPLGTNVLIPAGSYFMHIVSDAAPAVVGASPTLGFGIGSTFQTLLHYFSTTATGQFNPFPSVLTGYDGGINNAGSPMVYHRLGKQL